MSIQKQLSESASLISAVDAMRNWRAAALLLGSLVAMLLFFFLAGVVSMNVTPILGALFGLTGIVICFYGANAAGILLMDEAHGGEPRPLMAAIVTSFATGHRLVLVGLLVGVTYLAGLLVLALLLLLCKIPGVGPLLFAFVFPVSVIVAGVAIFALYAVVGPLAAPAVWSGASTMQAVSRLAAIARQRVVVVILSMIVLFFICLVVAFIIGGIMTAGTLVSGLMSTAIIGISGFDASGLMGMLGLQGRGSYGYGGGDSSAYVTAATIGGSIVWAVAFALPLLVYLRGCCQVYLVNLAHVDVEAMEEQLRGGLNAAKRKAQDIKTKGEALAAQQAARYNPPAAAAAAAATETAPAARPYAGAALTPVNPLQCPVCSTPYLAGDMFCGSCGHKLA